MTNVNFFYFFFKTFLIQPTTNEFKALKAYFLPTYNKVPTEIEPYDTLELGIVKP